MTTLKFSSEILDDILFRAGEQVDGTSDFEGQALIFLNRAYRALWMGGGEFVESMNEPWLWLKKDPPGVMNLSRSITAGTVSVTNNNTTITFSSAPAATVAGYHFKVDEHSDVFRVLTHTGGSATATIDVGYTGDTNAAAAYKLMKLEYTLASDLLRVVSPMRVQADQRSEIEGIDLNTLDRDWPITSIESGVPTQFAMVTETKARFNRYGNTPDNKLIRVEYDYLQRPADLTDNASEEPLVPLEYRQILSDIAVFYLYTLKNDNRVELLGTQVRAGLKAMAADNRARMAQFSRSFGQVFTRGDKRNTLRNVLRSTSGKLLDIG